jgi:hypothetical protein
MTRRFIIVVTTTVLTAAAMIANAAVALADPLMHYHG